MKKFFVILMALLMISAAALADVTYYPPKLEITLEGNPTTGYEWTGMVVAGSAVSMTEQDWTYVSDDETGTLAGAGGTYHVILHPEHAGRAIVAFSYARSWENAPIEQQLWLITVSEDRTMTADNVTETSLLQGTVLQVMESDHSVLLQTGTVGEVIAHIAGEDAMPVEGEEIRIYTDGTMALSLPAQVTALGWSTIPGELAR